MAGSALMQNEKLVAEILEAVVGAVDVPVTLKMRTGWDKSNRNAVRIARIAETSGIQALAIHGRTRACAYTGEAEYDTIAAVKAEIKIPVIANGDITTPEKAKFVLEHTGADAVMIGRAAQGRPWLFREIAHFLATGEHLPSPQVSEIQHVLTAHVHELYDFLWRTYRPARGAQAYLLVHQRTGRFGAFSPSDEPTGKHYRTITSCE